MTLPGDVDPRTPVIVGVGQICEHEPGPEPVDLIEAAARSAEADAGGAGLLAHLDAVRLLHILGGRYRDPGRIVAERIGAERARTTYTRTGGHLAQALISDTCTRIATGDLDLALVGGGEAWPAYWAERSTAGPPDWLEQPRTVEPDETWGDKLEMSHDAEAAVGLVMPVQFYPLVDVALRAADHISVAEHRDRVATLWAGASEVAAANPYAWSRARHGAAELRDPTPDNRMVGFPYTKRMNSNHNVAQAAVVIVASAAAADAAGVGRDRWVFPQAGADAHEVLASQRMSLARSPAMQAAGRSVLAAAGIDADDLGPVDLYSCFPSAVQLAARELGLGLDRPLTVTGGMSFAGGPWNNYTTHAVATLVDRLRGDPDQWGLVSGNGGMTSHESMGIYRGQPAVGGFRNEHLGVVSPERRDVAADPAGNVTVEAYTVMYGRDGAPEVAFISGLTDTGARAWATTGDDETMAALVAAEWCGRQMRFNGGTARP